MTHNPAFELPSQRISNPIAHDIVYTPEQLDLQKLVDSLGYFGAKDLVYTDSDLDEPIHVQTVEPLSRYL